jgi:hypothetical protein
MFGGVCHLCDLTLAFLFFGFHETTTPVPLCQRASPFP